MLLFILLWMHLLLFTSSLFTTLEPNIPATKSFEDKVQNVPMKTEEGLQMVQHWMDQAIGVFMAAVANQRLKTKPKHVVDEFGVCSNKAQTIPMQANCVSRLLKDQITGRKFLKKKKTIWPSSTRFHKYNSKKTMHMSERKSLKKRWIGGLHVKKYADQNYRAKRSAVSTRKAYELKSPNDGRMTPLGSVAHMLMKAVLESKNKTVTKPWQETVQRIRDSNAKRKLIKKRLEEESIENMEQFAFRGMKSRGMVGEDLHEIMEDPKRLKDFLTNKRNQKSKEPSTRLMNLLREGFKLGYTISGKNASKFDDKTLKIASPRFLSVVPENEETKDNELDFLSPSLFSLHNEGKGLENLTSLPSLVQGFSSKDQQAWLDLIMEAAGVVEEAEKIEKHFHNNQTNTEDSRAQDFVTRYKKESIGKDETPLYFTKENVTEMYGNFEERKINLFEKLCHNFSKEQLKEMNKTGFAMLSPKQLEMLYGSESPYNNSKALKHFSLLNNSVIHQHIEDEVSRTAEMKSFKIRLKQIVLSPVSFTVIAPSSQVPVILSPIIFSPAILAPSVLGPFVLSPALFVPVILSPRALGPLILSPLAFVPFILSPVVLHPVILSPGVFVPIILTPIALSPFILSPQVFTPLILSPFVLTPFILNPGAASPIILSPFALSPIIYSPQFFSALILSPYVLSPIIMSPLVAYTVLLSPSYLS